MTVPPNLCAAAPNPAIALRLQPAPLAGRVAELGLLDRNFQPLEVFEHVICTLKSSRFSLRPSAF